MHFEQLSDRELYQMCQKFGLNAKLWLRKFGGTLPEVSRRALWKKFGFHSIGEFASKLAGMGEETVKKILHLDEKLLDKPLLRNQLISGSQGWSKLQTVANVATPETDGYWAERVQKMSKPALEKFVAAHRQSSPGGEKFEQEVLVIMRLHPNLAKRLYVFKQSIEKHRKEPVNWNAVVNELLNVEFQPPEKDIQTIKAAVSQEIPDEASSRHIPAKVDRVLRMEYGGSCAFPGCVRAATARHHVKRFSIVPNHKPEGIVPLCKLHHSFMHLGLVENEEKNPSLWKLRKEPDVHLAKYRVDLQVQAHMRGG